MDGTADRVSLPPGRPVALAATPRPAGSLREQRLGERFAERLAAQDKSAGKTQEQAADPATGKASAGSEGAPTPGGPLVQAIGGRAGRGNDRFGGDHGHGGRDEDCEPDAAGALGTGAAPELRDTAGPAAEPAANARPGPSEAMIDRMAAAIAELHGSEASHTIRIEFPTGSAIAENALLTRDAQTGAISIRITGLMPGVKERRRAEVEDDLRQGLQRRQIQASVHIEPTPAHRFGEPGLGPAARFS